MTSINAAKMQNLSIGIDGGSRYRYHSKMAQEVSKALMATMFKMAGVAAGVSVHLFNRANAISAGGGCLQ